MLSVCPSIHLPIHHLLIHNIFIYISITSIHRSIHAYIHAYICSSGKGRACLANTYIHAYITLIRPRSVNCGIWQQLLSPAAELREQKRGNERARERERERARQATRQHMRDDHGCFRARNRGAMHCQEKRGPASSFSRTQHFSLSTPSEFQVILNMPEPQIASISVVVVWPCPTPGRPSATDSDVGAKRAIKMAQHPQNSQSRGALRYSSTRQQALL